MIKPLRVAVLQPKPDQSYGKNEKNGEIQETVGAGQVSFEVPDREQQTEVGGRQHDACEPGGESEGERTEVRVSAQQRHDDRERGAHEPDREAGHEPDDEGKREENDSDREAALFEIRGQGLYGARGIEHAVENHDAERHEYDID